MNNAPFSIGQKVVCIKGPAWGNLKKGDIVTVAEQTPCKCGVWFIGLIGHPASSGGKASCVDCDNIHFRVSYRGGPQWAFAPIQTQYADAIAEILEKFPIVNDAPDKVIIKEPVL